MENNITELFDDQLSLIPRFMAEATRLMIINYVLQFSEQKGALNIRLDKQALIHLRTRPNETSENVVDIITQLYQLN